jgi:hypothetical protein
MAAPAVIVSTQDERAFLDVKHPLYEEMAGIWCDNERRAEGTHVRQELWRFDWETKFDPSAQGLAPYRGKIILPGLELAAQISVRDVILSHNTELMPGEHYGRRQESAPYVNFMDTYADELVGGLMRERPTPTTGLDFGTLGEVRRKQDIDIPTKAELLYYNADGIGEDGSHWDTFWAMQLKQAMHTGYRWIFVEAKRQLIRAFGQQTRQYLVGFSPRDVTNWGYIDGQLSFACIRFSVRRPKIGESGRLESNDNQLGYYWMVRKGITDFGTDFSGGGWWMYGPDRQPMTDERGNPLQGTWDKTGGQIPLIPLFYDKHPRIFGRPATTELGQCGIALMNIMSAADFDAWDSAGSVQAVRGSDETGFNIFIKKVREGNRYAPLRGSVDDAGKQIAATVQDLSTGAITADVFEKRINTILRIVDRVKSQETFGTNTSGLSEQAGFMRGDANRLTLVAGNLETAQNGVISLTEQRAGNPKSRGSTTWPRKFSLIELTTAAQSVLQLCRIAGVDSPTLSSRVILASATEEGFIPDNEVRGTVESELLESADRKKQQQELSLQQSKLQTQQPDVPGDRSRDTPPEPAQTNQPVKSQLDGPEIP